MYRFRKHRKQNLWFRRVTAGRGTAGEHGLPPTPPIIYLIPAGSKNNNLHAPGSRRDAVAGPAPAPRCRRSRSPRQPRRRAPRPRQHPAGRPGLSAAGLCRGLRPRRAPRPSSPRRARGDQAERAQLSPRRDVPGAGGCPQSPVPGCGPRGTGAAPPPCPAPAAGGPDASGSVRPGRHVSRAVHCGARAGGGAPRRAALPAGGGHGPVRPSPAPGRSSGISASLPTSPAVPHSAPATLEQ